MLPFGMRDVVMLFEQEVARHNHRLSVPSFSRSVGMMERDLEFVYDLLLSTLGNTDSESSSEGSYHLVQVCNMLHLSENGAAAAGGEEDDVYPILRTPGE